MRTGEVSDGRPPWALLVYMVSDEPSRDVEVVDLDRVLAAERRALIAASAATGVPVAIQADYLAPHKTVQYFGLPDEAPQVGVLSNVNSTDPVEIQAFLKRAHQKFNAENYVVMFWGHSSGPSGLFSD